jgi:ABC-type Mn2+/Zn2+ transport system permease subunit
MYDVIVVLLSVTGILVVVALARAPEQTPRRWLPHSLAWIACGLLSLRGVAGLVVDGTADLIWWPTFLLGGVLYGLVAWFARLPHGGSARAA